MAMEQNGTMTVLANAKENPNYECIDWKKAEWAFTYLPPYMWFIFVLGVIENLFVISVFVLHKSRCTVTEIYLGNMAAADLILVSRHPFRAIYISNKHQWPFGGFMCAAVSFLFWLTFYSSIYFLMMPTVTVVSIRSYTVWLGINLDKKPERSTGGFYVKNLTEGPDRRMS
ncbi:B2 bradykinin receptor-like [Hyla sarda]|uniref:B2 bradykinin receptor-like n=1 Tax=Hyla sarda TaxID=327740 RepID=UPI0024C418CB|nr:B2 bradykinin receptor-like [Hyla sarda]